MLPVDCSNVAPRLADAAMKASRMFFDARTAPLHFAARPAAILHYLGRVLAASAGLMLVPLGVAFASGNVDVGLRYCLALGLLGGVGLLGMRMPRPRRLQQNEALAIVGLTFLLSSVAVAIPLTGYGLSPLDAWFDGVSAVTTTGLSTIASVEGMPFSFHFGRSWAQWVGGLGVVVLSLAVMLQPGVAVNHMGFDDREADDVVGGARGHARRILIAYACITILAIILIWAVGMPFAEALTDGLASVSTGGFAARDSSLGGLPPAVVVAVSFGCLLGAIPFYLYYRQNYRGWLAILKDPQFVVLVLVGLLGVAVVYGLTALHRSDGGWETLGDAAAMAVSAQTTAGFSTTSMTSLGPAATLAMCALMFVGGGLGSTSGGIKILRLIILARLFQVLLVRASTTEKTVAKVRLGAKSVGQEELEAMLGVVAAYVATISLSWIAFVASGYDPVRSLFEVTSAVGTAGISAGIASADLPAGLKIVLCLDMLLGRVETVAIVILLFPGTWIGKRRDL